MLLTAMGLTISLVLAGCYRTHTRASDAGGDAARTCAVLPLEATRVCQPSEVPGGIPIPIQVLTSCSECYAPGPCDVTLRGTDIVVRPTRTDCPMPCSEECVQTCMTPPLEIGGYRILVEGLDRGMSIRVRDRENSVGQVCYH